jgi:hypothetical protein
MRIDVEDSLMNNSQVNGSNFIHEESISDYNGVVDKSDLSGSTLAEKQKKEQIQKNNIARKRIDELIEKKRLKELLDDSEDW